MITFSCVLVFLELLLRRRAERAREAVGEQRGREGRRLEVAHEPGGRLGDAGPVLRRPRQARGRELGEERDERPRGAHRRRAPRGGRAVDEVHRQIRQRRRRPAEHGRVEGAGVPVSTTRCTTFHLLPLAALQASKADIKRVFRSKAEVSSLLNGTQADGFPDDASSPVS